MPENSPDIPIEDLLLASVVIQLADREERVAGADPIRSEVVLADAGLSLATIARLTGRNYETVKTTVRRARSKHPRRDA